MTVAKKRSIFLWVKTREGRQMSFKARGSEMVRKGNWGGPRKEGKSKLGRIRAGTREKPIHSHGGVRSGRWSPRRGRGKPASQQRKPEKNGG